MKKLMAILAALAIICASFFAGAYYTIITAHMSYDDGFYLMETFGNLWVYPDGEYWNEYPERFTLCDWNESI